MLGSHLYLCQCIGQSHNVTAPSFPWHHHTPGHLSSLINAHWVLISGNICPRCCALCDWAPAHPRHSDPARRCRTDPHSGHNTGVGSGAPGTMVQWGWECGQMWQHEQETRCLQSPWLMSSLVSECNHEQTVCKVNSCKTKVSAPLSSDGRAGGPA